MIVWVKPWVSDKVAELFKKKKQDVKYFGIKTFK